MDAAILTQGLTKYYGKRPGVLEVDLEVRPGEVFGFLGPNGAGKTTMIRTLMDLIRPTSGRAFVLGMDAQREGVEVRRRVGYLPGDLALDEHLEARDLLGYLSSFRGGVYEDEIERLASLLDAELDARIGSLSSGNRQKIGIVQAFMHRPELVVLDEPTLGLDPLIQQHVYRLLAETKADGRTVFLSSHNLPEVERTCDRVGIIRR
ncbi:MAG TPA: ABC transporter ATP-binding protein, partial [Actinomycetota bacterium]